MTLVERRIFRINDFVDNINPAQICVEPMEDPDLDFRMYCGTDILGNITKWLAKDQKARITDLSITDRLNMNTKDVVNVGSLYAPWTDLDNDIWARLRFYYNGAYPTSEFVQARPGLECGVRLDSTQSKAHFFCDTNRGLFFNGPEMTLKDYDSDTSKYNFLLTSNSSGSVLESEIGLSLGSAGSLSLFDANILSCEDWDTDTALLSATEQEVQNCFDLFGEVKSIFGMISALPGVTDLQRAYDNGHSVTVDDGVCLWGVPSDAATSYPAQSFSNLKTDNTAEVININNDSTHAAKKAIFFTGAAGDASSSGALGHRIWTNDSISIGRTASTGLKSYFVANLANISDTVVATRAQLYADGTDDFSNDVEAYISVIAGKQGGEGSRSRFSTIYGYSETGQAIWESGLGGKLTLGNSASLGSTASILSFYDANKAGYTNNAMPLSSSGQWSSIVSLAGDNCTLFGAILAASVVGVNPNALTLKIKSGTSEGTSKYTYTGATAKTLDFIQGTNVTLTAGSGTLTIASTNTTYTSSLGITLSGTDFRHSNSVTAKTQALYPIAYDAQGHITASGSAVTSLKNPNNLILKVKSGTVEGFDLYTYDGSAAKTLDIRQGSNITLTEGAGILTIAATDTTYTSSLGISLVGTDFRHSNSVTAQSTQALYPIKIDAQGHISGYGTAVTTLPNANALTLKIKSGTSEGTSQYTYTGAAAKTLDIRQGSNITLTEAAGSVTIAATDTTYPITNHEIAYGTGSGITSNSSLSWDTSNYYIRLFRASNTAQTDIRFYLENATGDRKIGDNRIMGRLRFYGAHDSSTHAVGISIDATTDGDWAVAETRSTKLGLYMRHQNVGSYVYTFKSDGSIYSPSLAFLDGNRATSDYTGTSVPLAKSIAEWSSFAAIAGAEGSLLGGIAAAKLGPAISAGQVTYGTGTSIAGKSTFIFDPSGGDTLSIGGLSASTRLSLAGTTAAGGSFSSRVYSTTADTAAGLAFSRSRHATLGTHGAVTTSDVLSNILSYGSDGSTFVLGSQISTIASGVGAWSTAGNQSARLAFSTINAGSFAEKMTLSSAGYLGIGTSAPEHGFHLKGTEVSGSTIRTDCYSTTGSEVASLRMYKSNHATSYGALANGDLIGRIRFIGSRPTSWIDGCIIEALSRGSWASAAGETTDLRVQLRHAGSTATRFLLTSIGGLGLGQHVTNDWTMGHFLASQRLDGSTAGSSQSIVAMTLGLRTTSTTANQVLKLTSSDSDSPLVLQAGYFYSLLVNVSATFESGDKKGYRNETYALTVFYDEVRDSALINSNTTTEHSNVSPGSFSFSVSSGVLQFLFTPSAFCSVDNPINVLATICGGTKIKTGQSQIC